MAEQQEEGGETVAFFGSKSRYEQCDNNLGFVLLLTQFAPHAAENTVFELPQYWRRAKRCQMMRCNGDAMEMQWRWSRRQRLPLP